ncbi:MAG: DUF4364 family protein [Oscillospiraceae bacterium]|nr:DUF4364 family protein [Oscillospiraceae bacterium]
MCPWKGRNVMSGWGFVHEKLDIKFLILYVMARVTEPVPFEDVLELSMCDDGFGYFDFSDCLAELVSTEHILLQDGLYTITEKGERNSAICESSLAYPVRVRADKKIRDFNERLRRRSLVRASITERENGTFTVSLSFSDDVANLMSLEMMVPQKEQAEALVRRFEKSPAEVYGTLIANLLYEKR